MNRKYRIGAILMLGVAFGVTAFLGTNHVLKADSESKQIITQRGQTIETPTESEEAVYPTNEQGQTYGEGPFLPGKTKEPDLIKAENEDGLVGYIKTSDLESGAASPEEAMEYQASIESVDVRSIPMYKSDGNTVIGQFKVGS
ncbi:hypothetical protein [Paenibacillus sp. 276b]|uniref:hypothetical protein n=1 Tax=Paenibacillus sp. 276b TaxID=1566277 RepID=UPI00089C3164|nr:hypothetical protein [Paenibacillus sp. 276b]SEB27645.1 hypothetical protein SAMN03159332_6322 [Paenibacillus sp. 276b]